MSLGTGKDQAYAEREDAAREDDDTDPEESDERAWLILAKCAAEEPAAHEEGGEHEPDSDRPSEGFRQPRLVHQDLGNKSKDHQHASMGVTGPEHRALEFGELRHLAGEDAEEKPPTELDSLER
jgi:hypothetical protein